MNLLNLVKNPKDAIVKLVATQLLGKAADGQYGGAAKSAYWFLHDYAPQIAIVINAIQMGLLELNTKGYCDDCAQIAGSIMTVVNFLGAVGLVFNLHTSEAPAKPGATPPPVVP